MQIHVTGHHLDVTPALKQHIEEKMQKIKRHFAPITSVHVVLSIDKKFQKKVEANVHLPKGELHATSEHQDMYAAIDLLVDKLDRQVIKHKEKLSAHHNRDEPH